MFKLEARDAGLLYRGARVLNQVSVGFNRNTVTALIGPMGSGKTAFLRMFSRMNEVIMPGCQREGDLLLDGNSIYHPSVQVEDLRRKVALIFSAPVLFPGSILDNLYAPLEAAGMQRNELNFQSIERALHLTGMWETLRLQLHSSPGALSPGDRQMLAISRSLVLNPNVLLLDAPTDSLDPVYTDRVETLIDTLRSQCTILIVTHTVQQAARVSDMTAFFDKGTLVEFGPTRKIFTRPEDIRTQNYLTNRY